MSHPPIRPVPASGRELTVDETGAVIVLPLDASGQPYRRYVCWLDAGSDNVHWKAGDSTLLAADVDTFDESTIAADPLVYYDEHELQFFDVYGHTHVAVRCAAGETATGYWYADDQFQQGRP